jgi:uncharacterized membrane protein
VNTVTESIEVDVPLRTAYNQWTQFEEFPRFMEGVKSVTQIDDTALRWVAEVGGEQQEWQAEIVDQEPDRRIAWEAVGGNGPNGAVTFEAVDEATTRINVIFEWQPEGAKESLGAFLGLDARQVKNDLTRFKELIETRGFETGAWRGEVHKGTTTRR